MPKSIKNLSGRKERFAARVLLIDGSNRVLLLSTRDASNPAFLESWELPGGGVLAGESITQAVIRELYEETGITLSASSVSSPLWKRDVLYTYRGERRLQHEAICCARIEIAPQTIDERYREPFEREDHLRYQWWPLGELRVSQETFYPITLPRHADALIAGRIIDEPLEVWDE
ncbi:MULTISPECIES: NUDIX hydrolase [Dickeya]|uniref:NUDIX hydrolase n=1 Tax=Dickeya fangzhongdai TaxID=1778540 RepID=A0A2K8QSW2_9GAMM|nr:MULTISPECIES: NUDIX domain-containing protein [Dickeya]ATZ96554.1 NUDIX hydrolase [Dickeya fangzhongdai]QOH49999.1 NUDIX domain-containing protein [Dickeya fangzhongdai]QOH54302.1 NUDIX domain-containing protein [Dickeya fangzhongdai]UMB77627.1 NUDIX domain-containing protein [Dickeya fangzhongdai]WES90958.1 NUDIX domain-containing protein [Dickeya fangzhongdai]